MNKTEHFTLHPQLERDCILIGELTLSRLLLMNDARFPWLILVPRRENLRELFELSPQDNQLLMDEVRHVSKLFNDITAAHKINIAALGNMVEQLHVHIIARHTHDAAWPRPVWGAGATVAYNENELQQWQKKLQPITVKN